MSLKPCGGLYFVHVIDEQTHRHTDFMQKIRSDYDTFISNSSAKYKKSILHTFGKVEETKSINFLIYNLLCFLCSCSLYFICCCSLRNFHLELIFPPHEQNAISGKILKSINIRMCLSCKIFIKRIIGYTQLVLNTMIRIYQR